MKKILYPDAAVAGNGIPVAEAKTSTSYTPDTDVDFLAVAEDVNAKWVDTPGITLLWITQPQFSEIVTFYRNSFSNRASSGSNRPSQTQRLRQSDEIINNAASEVKTYIERKFKKKNAAAQFPRYGIVKENANYRLPSDRDARKEALSLMISAINADGFADEEFGNAFWTGMKEDYNDAHQTAKSTDVSVTNGVAGKNEARKQINKVFTALRFVLRGHYPDIYQSIYREWGWQKENF